MSFRTSGTGSGSAFEEERRSLLQRDGLSFADVLTAARLAEVFDAEGVDFGDVDDPEVVDTPALTLQFLATAWLTAATHANDLSHLIELRLIHLASHRVGIVPIASNPARPNATQHHTTC